MSRDLGLAFAGLSSSLYGPLIDEMRAIILGEAAADNLALGEREELASYGALRLAAWTGEQVTGVYTFPPISHDGRDTFLREPLTLWEKVEALVLDLDDWRAHKGSRAVVVAVDPARPRAEAFGSRRELELALDDNDPAVTAGDLYAYASIEAGLPYLGLGEDSPATEPAFAEFAAKQGVPITAGLKRAPDRDRAVLAAIVTETARCLDLARRRRMAGRIDAFDALFTEPPALLAGALEPTERARDDAGRFAGGRGVERLRHLGNRPA